MLLNTRLNPPVSLRHRKEKQRPQSQRLSQGKRQYLLILFGLLLSAWLCMSGATAIMSSVTVHKRMITKNLLTTTYSQCHGDCKH